MIDHELLQILCCPVTHLPLREASPKELEAFGFRLTINGPEETEGCKSSDASSVARASCQCVTIQQDMGKMPVPRDGFDKEPTAGLVREDGRVLYPVRDGIPLLLPGEAIPLTREPSPQ